MSRAHWVYGRPPSMFPPASKNVATGGPFGSNGNGAVAGSRVVPPRPPPGAPPAGALPLPFPSPRPAGGALFARIHIPEKSGLPSAVRGTGASARTPPLESRGTLGSVIFGHCAATGRGARPPKAIAITKICFFMIRAPHPAL